jgi:hypothetical protein
VKVSIEILERARQETSGENIHFHPVERRALRASVAVKF